FAVFNFDSEKQPSTDTRLGCNLIDVDPFGFPGPLETRTKVGYFGMQAGAVPFEAAKNHMDTMPPGQLLLFRVFVTVRAGPGEKYEQCIGHHRNARLRRSD